MSARAASLHNSNWLGVFYLTGGGGEFLAELLGEPGASATVLEARVPYAIAALTELLGARPEMACSEATARMMAMAAFQRARVLAAKSPATGPEGSAGPAELFGYACTASLATNREKKGRHRAHAAIQTTGATFTVAWEFTADRAEEERQLSTGLWRELACAFNLPGKTYPASQLARTSAPAAWQELILGRSLAHATSPHDGALLFPGAFNPIHDAHLRMLEIAEDLTGLSGAFELSVANVDKPFLDYREIAGRLAQFTRPTWLTHLPTFAGKARHFPGAHFVIGLDTLIRIAEPGYYESREALQIALREFEELDIRFVVFGRHHETGFATLDDVAQDLPRQLVSRCIPVSRETFSSTLSSTSLRGRTNREEGC